VTVSEDGRVGRPPRYSPEKRAALGDEAWALRDAGWGSTRKIAKMFTDRGDPCSHTLVWELMKEAQDRARFLDFVGPAQSRAASIGRLDEALAEQLETIRSHKAALATGELQGRNLDYEKAAAVLDKAVARYVQLEQLWVKVTGAAMPTRHQVEDADGKPLRMPLPQIAGLERAVREHEHVTREMEQNDGLDG
jgi:hypothetical protein